MLETVVAPSDRAARFAGMGAQDESTPPVGWRLHD